MSGDVMLTDAERETLWEAIERAFLDTTTYSREAEAAVDRAVEEIVGARMAARGPVVTRPDGMTPDEMLAKWSGCWCGPQEAEDHDSRVRDCPQHGSDDCRHMAEGIVADLRALRAAGYGLVSEAKAEERERIAQAIELMPYSPDGPFVTVAAVARIARANEATR